MYRLSGKQKSRNGTVYAIEDIDESKMPGFEQSVPIQTHYKISSDAFERLGDGAKAEMIISYYNMIKSDTQDYHMSMTKKQFL